MKTISDDSRFCERESGVYTSYLIIIMKNLLPDPMVDDRAPIAYIDQGKLPHTVQTIMDMHELEQSVQSGSP